MEASGGFQTDSRSRTTIMSGFNLSASLVLHINTAPSGHLDSCIISMEKKLDDGWPESVEEQGLLLLVWRRNFRNDL